MKKLLPFALVALVIASCEDRPSTPPRRGLATNTDTKTGIDPNRPRLAAPPAPSGPITLKSFDGVVLAKYEKCFQFQGLSGQKYLIFPTQDLMSRPPDTMYFISFSQIKVQDKLRVRVTWKLPYVPVYVCQSVLLHGFKLSDGQDTSPKDALRDD